MARKRRGGKMTYLTNSSGDIIEYTGHKGMPDLVDVIITHFSGLLFIVLIVIFIREIMIHVKTIMR